MKFMQKLMNKILGIALLLGLFIQSSIAQRTIYGEAKLKFDDVLELIDRSYVDTVNQDKLVEDAVIAMTKDLLRHLVDPSLTLRDLVRPAVFIPETKRLNVLLQEFRSNRNHIAVVIDEHGGITGLVTLEDVLEQIVGEIEDEYDVAGEQTIFSDGAQAWRVLATTEIQAFNSALNTKLPDGDYDTIGGWLAHALGRIPHRGDFCLHKDLRIEVMRADSRRALWLRVKRRLLNDSTTTAKVD